MNESASASHIRHAAAELGIELWRNNVGVLKNEQGIPVRYGLCNTSAAMNKKIKSSDFIGIVPTIITQQMVGLLIGRFAGIETKPTDWVFSLDDERAVAQAAFHDIVRRAGGLAGFARTPDEMRKIIGR